MNKNRLERFSKSATKQQAEGRLKPEKSLSEISSRGLEYFQHLANLEPEAKARFEAFLSTNRNLPCIERAEEWLKFVVSQGPDNFGDQEAAIYLTSRGKDCETAIQKINAYWMDHEQGVIKKCAEGSWTSTVKLDGTKRHVGRKRHVGGMCFAEARKIEERSEFQLPNFWAGHRGQDQTIDATMLRTVEWCGMGGFEPWWRRLARRTVSDFIDGGVEPGSLVYWLFAMSRSQLASKIMPRALKLALDNIELVRTGSHPWTHRDPNAGRQGGKEHVYEEFEDIAHASAVVFANYSLRPSNERSEELLHAAAGLLQKQQSHDGSWPYFSHDKESSIEATAMAIHALALHGPDGWERNAVRAAAMLEASQEEGGYWVENSCPDPPYLSVLVLDALELAKGEARVTFGRLSKPSGPIEFATRRTRGKPGRKPKAPEGFVAYAGGLWRKAISHERNNVTNDQLREIAVALDETRHLPPAAYLEGKCAQEIRHFNSQHSNSKIGPIQTWLQLVSYGDKHHLRGMRRLLSRCSKKLDDAHLSGN
jgi:hypothetical protein